MKRVIFLSVVLTILALMLTGCEKPEPPAPVVFYTLSTIINGKGSVNPDKLSGIVLGSNVTIRITPETGYSVYSVKINGVKIEDIQPSTTEVQYIIKDINKNLNVEVIFVETGLLIVSVKSTQEQPWKWTKLEIYKASDNTFIRSSALTQAEKDKRYYFVYPSMELIVLNRDNSIYFQGTWNLKQNVFHRASEIMSLWEISKTKIVIAAPPIWSQYDNCYVFGVYTYERIAS